MSTATASAKTFFGRYQRRFENGFEKFRGGYYATAGDYARAPQAVRGLLLAFCVLSLLLLFLLGQDFFPSVDAGQMRLHVRAPRRTARGGNSATVR